MLQAISIPTKDKNTGRISINDCKDWDLTFELEYYSEMKANGDWKRKNGVMVIPEPGVSGAKELLHLCGYWYFPKLFNTTEFNLG